MFAKHTTTPIRPTPIHDAEEALTRLLAVSRQILDAWLSGEAIPPSNVRIAPDLIARVRDRRARQRTSA
jgi:hypothetical protein